MKTNASCVWSIVLLLFIASCQAPSAGTASGAPARVDLRGYITTRNYAEGQVVLFVEGIGDLSARYDRAWVLVTPTTRITQANGKPMSLHELHMGQHVAIRFRGGYRETVTGTRAIARHVWVTIADQE